MNSHTHTVLGLFVTIMAIRLYSSGRIQAAWQALLSSNPAPPSTPTAAPMPNNGNILTTPYGGGAQTYQPVGTLQA